MERKLQEKKGITLVALVVTIIVLIILAGVSINLVLGNNGIVTKAKQSSATYSEAQAREKLEMVLADLQTEKITKDKLENFDNEINRSIQENGMQVTGNLVLVEKWQFQIDRTVPKIIANLGAGEQEEQIQITMTPTTSDDYTKVDIQIEIKYEGEITSISFNGEEMALPEKKEGTYTIKKEIKENGTYAVVAKNKGGQYNISSKEIRDITEDMDIYNKEDMIAFRDKVNEGRTFEGRKVCLMNHLDLNPGKYELAEDGTITFASDAIQWSPIGSEEKPFSGTFEGNKHTIKGIYIDTTEANQALFRYLTEKGKISKLQIEGKITSSGDQVAGLVVRNFGTIERCVNKVSTTGITNVGGITIYNCGTIAKSANYATVISANETAGGVASMNGCYWTTGYIYESYNYGNVYAGTWVSGGIVACNGNFDADDNRANCVGYVYNCYNFGDISGGNDRRGGIIGQVGCRGGVSYVYNCYNAGNIFGCPDIVGAVLEGVSLGENYYSATTASVENLNKQSTIPQKLEQTGTYANNVWAEDRNNINKGFPILKWQLEN